MSTAHRLLRTNPSTDHYTRIVNSLAACGVPYTIHEHAPSVTIQDADTHLWFPVERLVKSRRRGVLCAERSHARAAGRDRTRMADNLLRDQAHGSDVGNCTASIDLRFCGTGCCTVKGSDRKFNELTYLNG